MADQGTEGLLSSFLRYQRVKAAKHYLKGRVLDIGCGTGILADIIPPELYLGIDIDQKLLQQACILHPNHNFDSTLPSTKKKFDTIVALAVIEHIPNPTKFLNNLVLLLKETTESSIIITTPCPSMDWAHTFGASVGLFSQHANEEHEELLNHQKMEEIAKQCNLQIILYKKFLLGANQLMILKREEII